MDGEPEEVGSTPGRNQFSNEYLDILLFRYIGHQIESHDQIHDTELLP